MRVGLSGSPSLVLLTVSAAATTLTSCSSIHLNPSKPTAVITWPQPAPIRNPAPLTSAQLDATANVPGTFVYSPPAGTVLAAGTQTLTTTFTPADTAFLGAATALVMILVNPAAGNLQNIAAQHMAVADEGNNRVLIYDAPIGSGASASLVLGQPNFTDSASSGNASYPNTVSPGGIAMDTEGDLFVADTPHCRVLEFQPPFTTWMNASAAIGWPSLTYADAQGPSCTSGPDNDSANLLELPSAVALDSQGNLWVADAQLAEVFEYVPPFSTGMAASIVLGSGPCQAPTFNVPSPTNFCEPEGLAFDPHGDLWVADRSYWRILEFKPPFSAGMAASIEIGQSTANPFAEATPCGSSGPSASCLTPATIAFDSAGDLWAADSLANRVLEFAPPYTNGMAASLVLGQPDFTSGALRATAANTFYFFSNNGVSDLEYYGGLSFDSSGDLLVGDGGNERILVFTPPLSGNMNASMVIGQPNMTSGTPCEDQNENTVNPAANTLCAPMGILTY